VQQLSHIFLYTRHVQNQIEKVLFQKYVIIIYGTPQVGKTALIQQILKKYANKSAIVPNENDADVRHSLKPDSFEYLISQTDAPDILVIDEAQRIKNIGLVLKIWHDNRPQMQIIASGSSSFDLANKINEPVLGAVWNLPSVR